MFIANRNGVITEVELIKETNKSWVVMLPLDGNKEVTIAKTSDQKIFDRTSLAMDWIVNGDSPE